MRTLRAAWGVRFGLPATKWMLELGALLLRTETELVLKSRRVVPGRLLEAGFEFQFPTWEQAAADLCRRWRSGGRRPREFPVNRPSHSSPGLASDAEPSALYRCVMGAAWFRLDPAVRRSHLDGGAGRLAAHGVFAVRHGPSRRARWLCRALRMPAEAEAAPVRLVVVREDRQERWHRTFAGRKLVTLQRERPAGLLAERFACLELRFRLEAEGGALVYRFTRADLRWGPVSVPLPRWCSPQVTAREEAAGDGVRIAVRVAVEVTLPLVGPLIGYTGEIERDEDDDHEGAG